MRRNKYFVLLIL